MDTMSFSNEAERTADRLVEASQALGARDRNVRLSGGIVPVSLNPEGRLDGCFVGGRPRWQGQPSNDLQQRADAASFLVVGVGGHAGRHFVA